MAKVILDANDYAAIALEVAKLLPKTGPDAGTNPPAPPVPPSPPAPPIIPPATDPVLARFLAAPSDWARWTEDNWLGSAGGGYQVKEDAAIKAHLMAKYGWADGDADQRMRQQLNAYNATIKLAGVYSPATKTYKFVRYIVGFPILTADTGGAADAYIASHSPGVVPGPLV